jgi:hypothetical protein
MRVLSVEHNFAGAYAINVNLDAMCACCCALQRQFQHRSAGRQRIDVPERHCLIDRLASYDRTEEVLFLAVV